MQAVRQTRMRRMRKMETTIPSTFVEVSSILRRMKIMVPQSNKEAQAQEIPSRDGIFF